MKTYLKKVIFLTLFIAASPFVFAQETATEGDMHITKLPEDSELKMYVIERNVEGIGTSSVADLQGVTKNSCGVLHDMGNTDIQWVQSYFTGDKIYCIYKARNKELIAQHAKTLGVPADEINEIKSFVTSEQ
ncbi:DUF4242 domain-containing protein [Robertkochia flava]|uniref:DUF4242 domain-containing protein n=1 Tax=Robertkochia flava TaxID=3447986 RepID=UPI001CCA8924|nr:DUF4242 domain-containing protein [Robertkochia marina]